MATDSTARSESGLQGTTWSFRYYMDPVGKHDDNFHLFGGPEGDPGSTILEGSFTFPGTHSDALKYGRLIAAAPELLDALKKCRLELDYCQKQLAAHGQTGSPNDSVSRALVAGRAAIDKAEGVAP